MVILTDKKAIKSKYGDYLSDESRLVGSVVERLYFPESSDEVCAVVQDVQKRGETLSVSGGRTGIVGGAVPQNTKNLMSLERLKAPMYVGYDGEYFARVSAGIRLQELNECLERKSYTPMDEYSLPDTSLSLFYPVNPTEDTAQIGGIVASNASGSRSFLYGPTRSWVRALTVVLSNGMILKLKRGEKKVHNGVIALSEDIHIPIGDVALPRVKNTVGYYLDHDMDAVDIFIGSEGTLGVITDVELTLIARPEYTLGQVIYFDTIDHVCDFLEWLHSKADTKPQAIEYFDAHSLVLLHEKRKREGNTSVIPNISAEVQAALFIEHFCDREEELDALCEFYDQALTTHGLSAEATWAGFDKKTLNQMALFRHALPEEINAIIGTRKAKAPGIRKLSSDMAVPRDHLRKTIALYEQGLHDEGFEYVMFGHIGDGNIHINILPRSEDEVMRGQNLFADFARVIVSFRGSVSAEHGIGRIKKELLSIQFTDHDIAAMRAVKKTLDPAGTLNPGVLFDV